MVGRGELTDQAWAQLQPLLFVTTKRRYQGSPDTPLGHCSRCWAEVTDGRPAVAGRIGRSAGASQHDAAASGLGVQHHPDGGVAVEVVGEALEHGEVGAADQLAVVVRDAVEGAVA